MNSLEDLYEQYSRPLYHFLLSMTGSETEAEELLQETFYQALISVDRFEGRCSPLTWLCKIGKNLWFRELGKKKRYVSQPLEKLALSDGGVILEEMVEKEEKERLRKAIHSLDEPYREIVLLHVYGERTLKDIAAAYGRTESWARVTFYRAKQKLAEEMLNGGRA